MSADLVNRYEEEALRIASILTQKNREYGNSFNETHKILEVLYPNGVKPENYHDLLAIVRILDKLFRISRGDQGEESAWSDLTGYGLLMVTGDGKTV
jgi:hypothetical protein